MPYLPFLDHIDPGQGGSAMVIPEYHWYNENFQPITYPCKQCSAVFLRYDEWFEHRFQQHPIPRPMLVISSAEVLTPRFVVTRAIDAAQIRLVSTYRCTVNGKSASAARLATMLANSESGFFDIYLYGEDSQVETRYEVSVEIPSIDDVRWVERDFGKLATSGSLSIHSINEFAQSTGGAVSARRYLDGLVNYLFGVLAKDRRGETALNQDQGRAKLNEAATLTNGAPTVSFALTNERSNGNMIQFPFVGGGAGLRSRM